MLINDLKSIFYNSIGTFMWFIKTNINKVRLDLSDINTHEIKV